MTSAAAPAGSSAPSGAASPSPGVLVTLPDASWVDDLHPLPEGVRVAAWDVDSDPREVLGEDADRVAAVVLPYATRAGRIDALADLPSLRLVQALSAGVDSVRGRVPGGIALANAAGVHDASTAELAVGLALASLRGIDDAVRDAASADWHPVRRRSLADRRVLLLGAGSIGGAIARRLAPFEVDLVRVARSARTDDLGPVHSTDDLGELLPQTDVVIVVLPLTDATRGLVDAAFLAALPGGALLVNVGRGPIVDTDALLAELSSGRLRAALDVVDPEPLPADHPLWGAPGLVLTPHVGGDTSAMRPRALDLLRRQLERLGAGEEPLNVVDPG